MDGRRAIVDKKEDEESINAIRIWWFYFFFVILRNKGDKSS